MSFIIQEIGSKGIAPEGFEISSPEEALPTYHCHKSINPSLLITISFDSESQYFLPTKVTSQDGEIISGGDKDVALKELYEAAKKAYKPLLGIVDEEFPTTHLSSDGAERLAGKIQEVQLGD